MNRESYAAALDKAVKTIAEKTGIDVSHNALPKGRRPEDYLLFALQKIGDEVQVKTEGADDMLARLEEVPGIGATTVEKIRKYFEA